MSVTLLLLLFLYGCQNLFLGLARQQGTVNKGLTAFVTIQKLSLGGTFMEGKLLINSERVYGFAKYKYTDRKTLARNYYLAGNITQKSGLRVWLFL